MLAGYYLIVNPLIIGQMLRRSVTRLVADGSLVAGSGGAWRAVIDSKGDEMEHGNWGLLLEVIVVAGGAIGGCRQGWMVGCQ